MRERIRRAASWFAISAVFALGACESREKVERWETPEAEARVEEKIEARERAPEQVKGKTFNDFFPADETRGFSRTFTQEKTGYAEAVYASGETEVKIAIADVVDQPETVARYGTATERVAGSPMMTRGKNSSMVLVNGRYQVKVSSQQLSPEERTAWLNETDLTGLAGFAAQ